MFSSAHRGSCIAPLVGSCPPSGQGILDQVPLIAAENQTLSLSLSHPEIASCSPETAWHTSRVPPGWSQAIEDAGPEFVPTSSLRRVTARDGFGFRHRVGARR